jgi:hypothetical protein
MGCWFSDVVLPTLAKLE